MDKHGIAILADNPPKSEEIAKAFEDSGRFTIIGKTSDGEEGANMKVKGTIHWVNANDCADVTLNMFDYLINDGDGDYMDRVNRNSLTVLHGKAEKIVAQAPVHTRFQFLREGYFIKRNEQNEFNSIVGLKDSYKPKN